MGSNQSCTELQLLQSFWLNFQFQNHVLVLDYNCMRNRNFQYHKSFPFDPQTCSFVIQSNLYFWIAYKLLLGYLLNLFENFLC